MEELVQRDLDFHIALTRAPGNPVLAEIGAKSSSRYWRFIQIRVLTSEQGPDAWIGDLPNHRSW
jgi:DNA-binding FadR family transcriptional regulator